MRQNAESPQNDDRKDIWQSRVDYVQIEGTANSPSSQRPIASKIQLDQLLPIDHSRGPCASGSVRICRDNAVDQRLHRDSESGVFLGDGRERRICRQDGVNCLRIARGHGLFQMTRGRELATAMWAVTQSLVAGLGTVRVPRIFIVIGYVEIVHVHKVLGVTQVSDYYLTDCEQRRDWLGEHSPTILSSQPRYNTSRHSHVWVLRALHMLELSTLRVQMRET